MFRSIGVLYEDEQFVIFHKPAGMLVIPAPKKHSRTLTEIVNEQYKEKGYGLHPCHRLDHETSGAIVYAKGKKNQKLMRDLFARKKVLKTYVALVRGKIKKLNGTISAPIEDVHRKRFRREAAGLPAVTKYKVLEVKRHFSVVEVFPETGRTHQIRIHFARIGHPLLGERLYAFRRDFAVDFKRMALHAVHVEFVQPVTRQKILATDPLPKDMENFLAKY